VKVQSLLILVILVVLGRPPYAFADGAQFSAPNVNGTSNVGNPQIGDIIFDSSGATGPSFWGYGGGTSGWLSLSGGTASYHAPTVQKFFSASGTYTTPTSPSPLYIEVLMVGGGGGGSGSGPGGVAGSGLSGGSSAFGTSLLFANGGTGADYNPGLNSDGTGGTATFLTAGPVGQTISGGSGHGNSNVIGSEGGAGGANPLGGAGPTSGGGNQTGQSGVGSSGAGGSGAGGNTSTFGGGAGGGAGGYLKAIIASPSATYSYMVGAGGTGGAPGTGGFAGGMGGSGYVQVTEYYQ
jgi:hypothetical protein